MPGFAANLPDSLWEAVRAHANRLLMLDYDGTLVPFRERRDEARLAAETRDLLAAIARSTELAIVSGRSAEDLERFVPLAITRIAEHGWDEITPEGRHVSHPLPASARAALEAAAEATAAGGLGERFERKRCSLVLHTRGLPEPEAEVLVARCERLWQPFVATGGLRLTRIASGRELRAPGRDKGVAVRERMAARPGALAVYVGDDATDEDAFRAVAPGGVALRVGARTADGSAAEFALETQAEVIEFLRRWRIAAAAGPGSGGSL